ncbi:MAG: dihydroorotase, partial [Gaiellales bacterium]
MTRLVMRPAEPAELLVRGARLFDPSEGLDVTADLLVRGGEVAQIADRIDAPDGVRVVEARGCTVLPGLVDPHVHLRVPGQEYKEDCATGSGAG